MKNKTLNVFSIYYHLHADLSSLDITRIFAERLDHGVKLCELLLSDGESWVGESPDLDRWATRFPFFRCGKPRDPCGPTWKHVQKAAFG